MIRRRGLRGDVLGSLLSWLRPGFLVVTGFVFVYVLGCIELIIVHVDAVLPVIHHPSLSTGLSGSRCRDCEDSKVV